MSAHEPHERLRKTEAQIRCIELRFVTHHRIRLMKPTVFVFLFLVCALALRAEIIVGSSLEWLADTSASVGIYQVTESRKESDSAFQLSFKLDDTLKGTPPRSPASSYGVRFRSGTQPPSVAVGSRFLIFFKPDDKDLVRVEHLINISTIQDGGWDSIAINSKFEALADQAQILATVRGRLKSHPTNTSTRWRECPDSRFDVEVPIGSSAFTVLFGGSSCYLLVPDDLKPAKPDK
jgi:hypothetical protein